MNAFTCYLIGLPGNVLQSALVELGKFGIARQPVDDLPTLELHLRRQGTACVIAPLGRHREMLDVVNRAQSPGAVICLALEFNVSQIVLALRCGVFHVLDPARDIAELPQAVDEAARRSAAESDLRQRTEQARSLLESLSKKEWEVLRLVLQGTPNKLIASRLNIAVRTVESRRSSIFAKLQTRSLGDIAAKVQALESAVPSPHFAVGAISGPPPREIASGALNVQRRA